MIHTAFIWHMHQPYYKDEAKGLYALPWVRLHGVKDYYPMAALLERFDTVKATFNVVPCLAEQIDDYATRNASDTFLELTLKRPADLSLNEKLFVLANFFSVNLKRFIEPNARYRELYAKRRFAGAGRAALRAAAAAFSESDVADLQALFNLAWFHSLTVEEDPELRSLIEKGAGYTEEDKRYVVRAQREVLARILPLYKRLQDAGRIEITTTPYYHPILPLLCDTDIARVSMPGAALPRPRFAHPEDARWQVESAMRYHASLFGNPPRGMWPSEGSVSAEALGVLIGAGLDWVATDEDILFQTLHRDDAASRSRPPDRRLIYRPYRFEKDGRSISVVFRDKNLSNLISFAYADRDPQMAALDLVDHLHKTAESMRREGERGLAVVVMDGENAWEYYEDNGRKFFELVYMALEKGEEVVSDTVSGYLKTEKRGKVLTDIFPGSWIDHDFKIWIGAPQDNAAWAYLDRARKELAAWQKAQAAKKAQKSVSRALDKAWRGIHVAEGSDWNWWYGPEHTPGADNPFDGLFRMHLANVYRAIKKPVPEYLKKPIG